MQPPTAEPSPVTAEVLLAGMVTEEVEPGVYRVINDGVRDLASKRNTDIVAGHEGGVWLVRQNRFFRLGDDAHAWPTEKRTVMDFAVAPDATVWTVQTRKNDTPAIEFFDGEAWTVEPLKKAGAWAFTLEVTPDGTVWALWRDPELEAGVFGHLDEDGWQVLGQLDTPRSLHVASASDIWATGGGNLGTPDAIWHDYVFHFVDGAWQRLVGIERTEATWRRAEDPVGDSQMEALSMGVGADGTLWALGRGLVRFDGSEWSRWPFPSDPGSMWPNLFGPFEVAPNGSLWFFAGDRPDYPCDGVGSFDGVTWDRHLVGPCVQAIDFTADGAVWLLDKEGDLYVITPEAVVATE